MGTRDGVEKLPNGIDNSPATKKQNDLICTALKTDRTVNQNEIENDEGQGFTMSM